MVGILYRNMKIDRKIFINEYNINSKKEKQILLQITVDDFVHSLKNTNVGFEHEVLYVFVPRVELFNALGESEIVDIYLSLM